MRQLKDLCSVPKDEAIDFVNSFDFVFCDVDGVLLLSTTPIPGSDDCIDNFKRLGKQIAFVTNNTIASFDTIREELRHFAPKDDEIVTPVHGIIAYLDKIQCSRDIYCIAGTVLRNSLKEAGYNIVEIESGNLEESMSALKNVCLTFLEKSTNVGAIVIDLDVNFKLIQAEGAILLLTRNPDITFLSAATDVSGPLTEEIEFIGNKFYVNAIERIAGKKCTIIAKPSLKLTEYLNEEFKISDPKRVLFIGDSPDSDIQFANQSGYQSLLVLSGQTKMGEVTHWHHDEENKPDYYVKSLKCINEMFSKYDI